MCRTRRRNHKFLSGEGYPYGSCRPVRSLCYLSSGFCLVSRSRFVSERGRTRKTQVLQTRKCRRVPDWQSDQRHGTSAHPSTIGRYSDHVRSCLPESIPRCSADTGGYSSSSSPERDALRGSKIRLDTLRELHPHNQDQCECETSISQGFRAQRGS